MERLPIPATIREFLRNDDRAGNALIWGAGTVCAACVIAALLAIAFIK